MSFSRWTPGSPPHVRGKAAEGSVECLSEGITPACAGKSSGPASVRRWCWDHPRVCGEKISRIYFWVVVSGSPPRVRGKAGAPAPVPRGPRITPACAGKRSALSQIGVGRRDHPRMCGEKAAASAAGSPLSGSPPHVRGKGVGGAGPALCAGITPACAGKSTRSPSFIVVKRDHPRVCGEKFQNLMGQNDSTGSPPRVRGKVPPPAAVVPLMGITPACAGKSKTRLLSNLIKLDHPRVCGEKRDQSVEEDVTWGSPPRVRGKVQIQHVDAKGDGDHPRVCGEKSTSAHRRPEDQGSPPRVRGKVPESSQ